MRSYHVELKNEPDYWVSVDRTARLPMEERTNFGWDYKHQGEWPMHNQIRRRCNDELEIARADNLRLKNLFATTDASQEASLAAARGARSSCQCCQCCQCC